MTATQSKNRGIYQVAAALLVSIVGINLFFITGVTANEVSQSEYREALLDQLDYDDRLIRPSEATDAENQFYDMCLTNGTYNRITARGRDVVAHADNLGKLHDNDFEIIVFRARDCRGEVYDDRDQ